MKQANVVSTAIKNGYRFVKTKISRLFVEETKTLNPFGFDSNVPKGFIAVIAETSNNSDPVIVGYLNKNAMEGLKVGDSMQYSTDENGITKSTLILRNDGTAELLGNADNAIRYAALNTALQVYVEAVNNQLITALAPVPYIWLPIDLDISLSKIEEIKTP